MTRNSSRFIAEGRHGVVVDNSAGQGSNLLAGRAQQSRADEDLAVHSEQARNRFFWRAALTDRNRKVWVQLTKNRARSALLRATPALRRRFKSPVEPV